jgi:hypothetical protein
MLEADWNPIYAASESISGSIRRGELPQEEIEAMCKLLDLVQLEESKSGDDAAVSNEEQG